MFENIKRFSSSDENISGNEGPSIRKKLNMIKHLKIAGLRMSNLKSGLNQVKMNTLQCAAFVKKKYPLNPLED